MATYTLEKSFPSHVQSSPNVLEVAEMFGLGTRRQRPVKVIDEFEINIEPGQVVYITGGSGAGKTLLLKLLKQKMSDQNIIDLAEQKLPKDKPLVDCFDGNLAKALQWLSLAGLSDAFAILRSPQQLSDGQLYRFKLAMAMAQQPKTICIDEFCAALDRVTAAVVAHNVRKFADKFGTTFLIATSHDDLLEDLAPDVVAIKHLGSQCDVYYPGKMKRT